MDVSSINTYPFIDRVLYYCICTVTKLYGKVPVKQPRNLGNSLGFRAARLCILQAVTHEHHINCITELLRGILGLYASGTLC